jgi:hypothetical protein
MKPHRGATVLVFGILSLVVCPIFGVAAWMMGNGDLQEMGNGYMDPTGRDLTNAGRICGMVGTGLLALQVLIILVAVVGMVVFSAN